MTVTELYQLMSVASCSVIATLAAMLYAVKLPAEEKWRKLRKARMYLAVSYSILAVIGFLNFAATGDTAGRHAMFVVTLFIASSQALLFTATIFVFICPLKLTRQWMMSQIASIAAATTILAVSMTISSTAFAICRVVALALYVTQLCAYVFMFHNRYVPFVRQVETFYDDVEEPRLKWIRWTFRIAGTVGGMALAACIVTVADVTFETIQMTFFVFTIVYTAFYIYMTTHFYSYCIHSSFIVTAVTKEMADADSVELPMLEQRDADFKAKLDKWVAEKRYLQKDLAVEDIAAQLGSSRSYIYFYFRTYMHANFRSWRSELRINEAKKLLVEHPDWTLDKIADMAGFNHRANFFQQFQKLTGMKPSDFRNLQ